MSKRPWDENHNTKLENGFESYDRWQEWLKDKMTKYGKEQLENVYDENIGDFSIFMSDLYRIFCNIYDDAKE